RELLDRRAGHRLGGVVPALVLARAEVRAVEDLLQAEDLHALLAGLVDQRQVLLEHRGLDLGHGLRLVVDGITGLDEARDDLARHWFPLQFVTRPEVSFEMSPFHVSVSLLPRLRAASLASRDAFWRSTRSWWVVKYGRLLPMHSRRFANLWSVRNFARS